MGNFVLMMMEWTSKQVPLAQKRFTHATSVVNCTIMIRDQRFLGTEKNYSF